MDRFYRGFVAGVVGGLAMNVWSLFSYYILNFSEQRFLDWASMIIYGSLPTSTFQIVYAQIIQLLWVGLLGIIFALLIPAITSRFYLGKGVIYGLMSGFIIYAITTLFRIPNLVIFSTTTVLSNHIGGIIWGLTMAYVLRLLDTTPLRN